MEQRRFIGVFSLDFDFVVLSIVRSRDHVLAIAFMFGERRWELVCSFTLHGRRGHRRSQGEIIFGDKVCLFVLESGFRVLETALLSSESMILFWMLLQLSGVCGLTSYS